MTTIRAAAAAALLLASGAGLAGAAGADTLDHLERERARLVQTMLDASLAAGERHARLEGAARRLRDLERMVLRDDALTGRNTPTVKRAFANYDLTFLVHAAGETGRALTDQWLEQVGISTDSLLATRAGRR